MILVNSKKLKSNQKTTCNGLSLRPWLHPRLGSVIILQTRKKKQDALMVIFLALVILRSKETCSDLKQSKGKYLLSEDEVLTHC